MTKHIKKLAAELAAEEQKIKRFPTSQEAFEEMLSAIKRALLNGTFYATVERVSPSGMSRVIQLGYITNNAYTRIWNRQILRLASCDKNGRIHGCGMDMLFAAQDNLWHNLMPKKPYQEMKRYNTLF